MARRNAKPANTEAINQRAPSSPEIAPNDHPAPARRTRRPSSTPTIRATLATAIAAAVPAARTTLNAKNLEALGAEKLAALLLEISDGNAATKRRLRLALAEGEGAENAAREMRKRFKAIDQASTFLDAAKRKTLLAELEGHLSTLSGSIRREQPALALDLHWELLELSEGIFDRCYDSSGQLDQFFRKVLEALPASLQAAKPKPAATAERIVDALQDCNGYGQLGRVIPVLAEALGRDGLEALRQECVDRGAPEGSPVLLAIADALGDVESFVAAFDAEDLQWPANAAAVAERLVRAGRAEEALAVVEGVNLEGREWMGGLLSDPHIAALEALGRRSDAQAVRWAAFEAELNTRHLRDYLKHLPDFDDVEAEEKALDRVLADDDHYGALSFLLAWPDLRRAAQLVLNHAAWWDGNSYDLLAPAAEQLEADHPLAATVLLRSMVTFALEMGRAKRYRYAANHLVRCGELASRIEQWEPLSSHALFAAHLRQDFGRKYSFWELVNEQND